MIDSRIPVGLSLIEVDEYVRRRCDVDIVLIEVGAFFSAYELSAEHLSQALGFRIGVDRWHRRITGFPVQGLIDKLMELERLGRSFAVVLTVRRDGRTVQRAIWDGATEPERLMGRRPVEHGSAKASGPAAEIACKVGPEPVSDPEVAIARLDSSASESTATGESASAPRHLVSNLAFGLLRDIMSGHSGCKPALEVLRELRMVDINQADRGWRALQRQRLLDARVGMLIDCWEEFLSSGSIGSLRPLRVQDRLANLAHGILKQSVRRRRSGDDYWSRQELERATAMFLEGRTIQEIAAEVDRPRAVTIDVIVRAGLPAGLWPKWFPEDLEHRDSLVQSRVGIAEASHELARSPWDVVLSLID